MSRVYLLLTLALLLSIIHTKEKEKYLNAKVENK